jgi:Calcineurin-like phosphoesterase
MRDRFAPIGASLVLLLAACATLRGGGDDPTARFEFALIGDIPYDARHEREFANVMKDINSADLVFVVHNGDFWWDGAAWTEKAGGHPPCSDEAFQDRLRLAQSSRHPFVFVPGDNEWVDCHRAKPRTYEPFERLAKLRQMFFSGDSSLGQRPLRLARQGDGDTRYAKFRENVRWTHGNVLFVTLHVIGSNNNLGRTPEMDAEYAERTAANLRWMSEAFDLARRSSRAIMIIAQANPRFETTWPGYVQQRYMLAGLGFKSPESRRATGFDEFLAALEKETLSFGKPVVYVHGDTHIYRVDKPLFGSTSQRSIENFTRVETVGYPDAHWVRASVDPANPNVFSFRLEIVKENLLKHGSRTP